MQTSLEKDDCIIMTANQLYRPMDFPLGDIVIGWKVVLFSRR